MKIKLLMSKKVFPNIFLAMLILSVLGSVNETGILRFSAIFVSIFMLVAYFTTYKSLESKILGKPKLEILYALVSFIILNLVNVFVLLLNINFYFSKTGNSTIIIFSVLFVLYFGFTYHCITKEIDFNDNTNCK